MIVGLMTKITHRPYHRKN